MSVVELVRNGEKEDSDSGKDKGLKIDYLLSKFRKEDKRRLVKRFVWLCQRTEELENGMKKGNGRQRNSKRRGKRSGVV